MAQENPAMAGSSPAYPQRGKHSMSKTQTKRTGRKSQAIDPLEAAEILTAAVRYCQEAGLKVQFIEGKGALWLAFPGYVIVPLPGGGIEITNPVAAENVPLPDPV
jgi:hypothetical protein